MGLRLCALCLVGLACVQVRGGAVELAWGLFAEDGSKCCPNRDFCRAVGAETVRIHLRRNDCAGADALAVMPFACRAAQGATAFLIPPGTYCITVDAADASGTVVATGPTPLVRDVVSGDVVELGAVALTVSDPMRCPPDDAQCL